MGATDKLLFQVELVPPTAQNARTVSQAIDSQVQAQQKMNKATRRGSQEVEEQTQNYNKFKQEIREIKTAVGEAENASRFFNQSNEEGVRKIKSQGVQLQKLQQEIEQANLSTKDRVRLQDKLQTRMRSLRLSQQKVEMGWKGMAASQKRGNQLMMSSGRILQDLPYGFIGISNNIEQFALEFRRAVDSEGGMTGAIKAMGSSLMGSGGLLFLLGSALPFALTVATNGFPGFNSLMGDSSDKAKKLSGDLKKVVSGLQEITDVSGKDPFGLSSAKANLRSIRAYQDGLSNIADIDKRIKDLRLEQLSNSRGSYKNTFAINRLLERKNTLLDQAGLSQKEYNQLKEKELSLESVIQDRIQQGAITEAGAIQINQMQQVNELRRQYETGVNKAKAEDALEGQKIMLQGVVTNWRRLAEATKDGSEAQQDYMDKILSAQSVIKEIDDTLEDVEEDVTVPVTPTLEANVEEWDIKKQLESLDESLREDMDLGLIEDAEKDWAKFMKKYGERQVSFRQSLSDRAFSINQELASDRVSLEISTQNQLESIREEAYYLGLENTQAYEDAVTAIKRRAVEKRKDIAIRYEEEKAQAVMGITSQTADFVGSINSSLKEESKTLAIIELAINKGLKIAQVANETNRRVNELKNVASEASAKAQMESAMATSAFASGNPVAGAGHAAAAGQFSTAAGSAASQAGTVAGSGVATIGMIAATGISEAAGIIHKDNDSGSGGGSGGSSSGLGTGFHTTESDEEERERNEDRSKGTLSKAAPPEKDRPIYLQVSGDISDESISLRAEKGYKERRKKSIFVGRNS